MSDPTRERIQQQVDQDDIVLYMKGTPVFPMCGFSAGAVQVLSHLGVRFQSYNVLEDQELREGIKSFSNWPTIPQLYVKGEFVGGFDIMKEMFEAGEIQTMMAEKGLSPQDGA